MFSSSFATTDDDHDNIDHNTYYDKTMDYSIQKVNFAFSK
jgi:hypothetical protein